MSNNKARINIIMDEVKFIATTLQSYLITPVDNGTLISILKRLSILQAQLTYERKWRIEPDFTLIVQFAKELIDYIIDPLVIDPYYHNLKSLLPTSTFEDPKILYLNSIIQLLNKPTITKIN
jgi:hypothetical protein